VAEIDFTAGITLNDGRVFTVDVRHIDDSGMRYRAEGADELVAWSDVKAVMLATSDHMLETAGYTFSMAELVLEKEESQPYDAAQMRQLGFNLLRDAAPRFCPLGAGCALGRPEPPPDARRRDSGPR
jgi:hypothetical protein